MDNSLHEITPEYVVAEFIEEYYLVEAIEAGDVIDSFFYDIDHTQSRVIQWFWDNVVSLPDGFYVNTMEYTQRHVIQTAPFEIEGNTIYPKPVTDITYYQPLYNLDLFLQGSSKETRSLFANKGLYSKFDAEDNEFEFLIEEMYTDFLAASSEIQYAFAKDLIYFIKHHKTHESVPPLKGQHNKQQSEQQYG